MRRIGWPLALVLVWVALAIADIFVINPFGAASRHPAARAAGPDGGAAHRHSAPSGPSSARTGQASPPASPSLRVLVPVGASAFGPSGNGSGDNPQGAALAIDGSAVTAWRTSWYRSAALRGANLELLTGKLPVMAKERVQARVVDGGGTLHLTLARPERARYLLIWFTLLPPDSAGTFREAIYSVRLKGDAVAAVRRP